MVPNVPGALAARHCQNPEQENAPDLIEKAF